MDLTAHAGPRLVAETLLAVGLESVAQERLRVRQRCRPEFAELQMCMLMVTAGGDWAEDVQMLTCGLQFPAGGQ
jgi:hypothetical protein